MVQYQTEQSIIHTALLGRKAAKYTQLGEKKKKKIQSLGPRKPTVPVKKRKLSRMVKEAMTGCGNNLQKILS